MQIRPVEYVCTSGAAEHTNIQAQETLKIIKNCPSPPVQTTLSYKEAYDALDFLKKYFTSDKSKWPEPLIKA